MEQNPERKKTSNVNDYLLDQTKYTHNQDSRKTVNSKNQRSKIICPYSQTPPQHKELKTVHIYISRLASKTPNVAVSVSQLVGSHKLSAVFTGRFVASSSLVESTVKL